ncbi:MAG: hypothetical protein MUE60_06910 [Candidatus Eisenbacteria bacterium]|jgi:hypothetical protein|nr:hypothetical protein [Candidatus Eisenbacteria bacterium]
MLHAYVVALLILASAGDPVSPQVSPRLEGGHAVEVTCALPAGRLARAIHRLQGTSASRPSKVRYRLVTLLGGKLTARVST